MGAEGGDDKAHFDAGLRGGTPCARRNGSDHLRLRQSLCGVQMRTPTHLKVGNVLCRLGAHQLFGGTIKRLGILKKGDRQVKCAEQVGLIGATLRGDEGGAHPCPIPRGLNVARCGKFECQGGIK